MTDQGIWIFLDDSNLWIEAKKLKAPRLIKEFTEDPRVRIDVGELADLISKDRKVNKATLYGSKPPPNDTVWEKMEKKGWKIKVHEKSQWTGREKKVDTQIVADVTRLVCVPKNRENGSTVAIVSGDNDMSPCIEIAIEEKWNVEVWAMKSNLGGDLKRLQRSHPLLMTVHDLSQPKYFNKFTFTNETFDITKEKRETLSKRGVVLVQCVQQLQSNTTKEFKELKEILDKFAWPWKLGKLLQTSSEAAMSQDLVIMFLRSNDKSLDEDTPLLRYKPKLEKQCVPKLCKQVLTYFEYSHQKHSQDTTPDLCFNRFSVLEENDPDESRAMDTSGRISPSEANQQDSTQKMDQDPVQGSSRKSKLTEPNEDPHISDRRKRPREH